MFVYQGMAPLAELAACRAECRALADRAGRLEDDLGRAEERLRCARAESCAACSAAERAQARAMTAEAGLETALSRCTEQEQIVRRKQVFQSFLLAL